jgi:endonuclease/exonuclease/phosphatase family metal-dependent hydrolase
MRRLVGILLLLAAAPLSGARAQPAHLRLMTFNVWGGEDTASGRDKLTQIIRTSGADVVALQEMTDGAGRDIAEALGFNYHQQSGGDIQVLSRFPVVGQSTSNSGVEIAMGPWQHIWLFNAHFAPYPYQPYDLRDGMLPKNEAAVIAAANATRGGEVTHYLSDMGGALASAWPVFVAGDFNEPSHLDWTAAAAAATPRSYDLKVEYPASKRFVDAGMTDSFRAVRPDEVSDPAYTWTPGYPWPVLDANEVHDRIDIIYHRGPGVSALAAATIGPGDGDPNTDVAIAGYNADHRAVIVDFQLPLLGDLNFDGMLTTSDWVGLRNNQHANLTGLTALEARQRGDLNGDFRNDHTDFSMFKELFEVAHGAGSFAALLAVPEPAGWVILAAAGCALSRKRRGQPHGRQGGC